MKPVLEGRNEGSRVEVGHMEPPTAPSLLTLGGWANCARTGTGTQGNKENPKSDPPTEGSGSLRLHPCATELGSTVLPEP